MNINQQKMFCSTVLIVHLLLGASLGMTKKNGSAVIVYSGGKGDEGEGQFSERKYKKSDDPKQFVGCPSMTLNDSQREQFLTLHNWHRSRLARGFQEVATGKAPKASQMYQLAYSCELERSSQEHADACKYNDSGSSGKGENIYTMTAKELSNEEKINRTLGAWWSEIANISFRDDKPVMYTSKKGIDHFAQMAWATNTHVGCGISSSCKDVHVVCQYYPGGNIEDTSVYATGSPCERDRDCKHYNGSVCMVIEGLCLSPPMRTANGAAGYMHGWLGFFSGGMTKEELLIGTGYFGIVSGLLAII